MNLPEQTGYLAKPDGDALYMTVGRGQGSEPQLGVVLMPPFGAERKGALRPLAVLARRLNAAGIATLRFDYAGSGESTGAAAGVTLARMRQDAQAVLAYGRQRWASARWMACGIRLGANLACELVGSGLCQHAVLVEPLLNGSDYIDELLRRSQIREMMADGQASTTVATLQARWARGDSVDLDGILVSATLGQELGSLELAAGLAQCRADTHIDLVRVTAAREFVGGWQDCASLVQRGGGSTILCREKPFWGQLHYTEPHQTLDACLKLLSAAATPA